MNRLCRIIPFLFATGVSFGAFADGTPQKVNSVSYPTHAALIAATKAFTFNTVIQTGFTAAGDGGQASYQWNAGSYCNGGTSGSPVAADGINCILPSSQSSSTGGRYLLQSHGSLDVRQVGMQPTLSGGTPVDNSAYFAGLMTALGPSSFNGGTTDVVFPGVINREYVAYYFSDEMSIRRNANYQCSGAVQQANTVELVFAAGVDGIVQEDGGYSSDTGYGGGAVTGCTIVSLGYGYVPVVTPGGSTLLNVAMSQDPGNILPASTWSVGDGIAGVSGGMGGNPASAFPAFQPGAFVSGVSGSTLTLSGGYTVNADIACCGVVIAQLPAALKFTVQTTNGDSSVLVTGGPRLLVPGDLIWSDAFPFGTTVYTVSGTLGNQTVVMGIPFLNTTLQNASVTHTGGAPGQMWILPSGLKRDISTITSHDYFFHWPIGLEMACTSAASLNCTTSHDSYDVFEGDWVGRWVAGNNTGASDSTNEMYAANYLTDVMEGGTVGSTYFNLNSNSVEGGNSLYGIIGNCINQNYSVFVGGYIVDNTGGCAASVGLIPPTTGPWPLAVGPVAQAPTGAPTMSIGAFLNAWDFTGANGCVGLNQTSPFILSASPTDCGTLSSVGIAWDAATGSFYWGFGAGGSVERWAGQGNYLGYSGSGNWSGAVFPGGGLQLGNNSQDFTGQERIVDSGTSAPTTDAWHLQGDTRLNQVPTPGSNLAWINTPSFTTTLSANVTIGVTTSVAVAACPSPALPVGTPIIDLTGTSSGGIVLSNPLGTLSGCSATTLTFQSAASNSGTSGDTIQFLEWRPAAPVAVDTGGIIYLPSSPVAIGSLPTCSADNVGYAVVNNGVASPTYNASVSTTGSSTRPVFCDGSGWTYH